MHHRQVWKAGKKGGVDVARVFGAYNLQDEMDDSCNDAVRLMESNLAEG